MRSIGDPGLRFGSAFPAVAGCVVAALAFWPASRGGALAGELNTFADYEEEYHLHCLAPFQTVKTPEERTIDGKKWRLHGFRAELVEKNPDGEAVIGVISAVKDSAEETFASLSYFLRQFREAGVELVVVNGDVAYDEMDLQENFRALAEGGLPVLVLIGNSETVGAFNGAAMDVAQQHKNLVNMNLVRFVDFDDVDLVSLPGYYNRLFVHASGGCIYRPKHLKELAKLTALANDPLVLVSHGPPRQKGPKAIDMAEDVGNVGDPALTEFIREQRIPVGLFGHILEAGGRAVNLAGTKVHPQNTLVEGLYLNAGGASSTPWKLLNGKESYGMAAIVHLKGSQAEYRFLHRPEPD